MIVFDPRIRPELLPTTPQLNENGSASLPRQHDLSASPKRLPFQDLNRLVVPYVLTTQPKVLQGDGPVYMYRFAETMDEFLRSGPMERPFTHGVEFLKTQWTTKTCDCFLFTHEEFENWFATQPLTKNVIIRDPF